VLSHKSLFFLKIFLLIPVFFLVGCLSMMGIDFMKKRPMEYLDQLNSIDHLKEFNFKDLPLSSNLDEIKITTVKKMSLNIAPPFAIFDNRKSQYRAFKFSIPSATNLLDFHIRSLGKQDGFKALGVLIPKAVFFNKKGEVIPHDTLTRGFSPQFGGVDYLYTLWRISIPQSETEAYLILYSDNSKIGEFIGQGQEMVFMPSRIETKNITYKNRNPYVSSNYHFIAIPIGNIQVMYTEAGGKKNLMPKKLWPLID
jgi:hypothetical protein